MPVMQLCIQALPDIPIIQTGDDLAAIIVKSLEKAETRLQDGDVLVISSKIISKSEGCLVDLKQVEPSEKAYDLAEQTRKDPRLVELVLRESTEISRFAPYVLIVRHRLGFTSANAGIDQSNTGSTSNDIALLLPADPDRSAENLAEHIQAIAGVRPAIVISDTHGRPFRLGNQNVAIGVSGMPALLDQRGQTDLFGRELKATLTAFADQVASAAGLVSGESDEGQPVILLRGLAPVLDFPAGTAAEINRPPEQDLYC